MKKLLSALLVMCMCLALAVPVLTAPVGVSAASTHICMIVTNPAENSSTAMNINFHADLGYTNCYVQYTEATDTSWASAKTQTGTYVTYGANSSNPFYGKSAKKDDGSDWTQTTVTFLDYSVTLSNLKPDTKYMYRIYDGSDYTATYKFKTAANDGSEWSFLVTGDFHEYYKNYAGARISNANKAINAGLSLATQLNWPEVEHIVGIGDIVAWGVDYNQWTNVYETSWIQNYSFANTIGNHDDMDRSSNSSNKYNSINNNYPLNGYGSQMGTCFYYIYNNVLFIYINYLDTSSTAEAWADSVVAANAGKYQYSVLVNHRPATNKYTGKTYSYFWNYWADFCDRNHIDLVLAGDHHVYMRSAPIYGGSVLSGYSASNPDATVYLAADSTDGERGSSDKDSSPPTSSWSNLVASHYYRYEYSSSTKDMTTMIIHVGKDKMTTEFVYYENSSSASHPSFREGSVSGHSSFYYGDTSYVYPSDHGYTGGSDEDDYDNYKPIPARAKNFLSASGGQYMYSGGNYPGGPSYYSYAYYGDNSNQGGSYITGKLNDGVFPGNSSPGSSVLDWAVFFCSEFTANGTPVIYLKLSETAYLHSLALTYHVTGNYGEVPISSIAVSTDGSNYVGTAAYTTSTSSVSSNNVMRTLTFNSAVQARYIKLTLGAKTGDYTRYAIGEIEVWGDTTIPEPPNPFQLIEESTYVLDETFVTARAAAITAEAAKEQFKCEVSVLDLSGKEVADAGYIGTGFTVVRKNSKGEITHSAIVVIPGDLSGDGAVNTTDMVAVRKLLSASSPSDLEQNAADVTGDDTVNTTDLLTIRKHCSGRNPIY